MYDDGCYTAISKVCVCVWRPLCVCADGQAPMRLIKFGLFRSRLLYMAWMMVYIFGAALLDCANWLNGHSVWISIEAVTRCEITHTECDLAFAFNIT